jgi:hypothetical protein
MIDFGPDPRGRPKETESADSKMTFPDHFKALTAAIDVIRPDCGRFQFSFGATPGLGEYDVSIVVGPKN